MTCSISDQSLLSMILNRAHSGVYAMQVLDMLDMRTIVDMDDSKYGISGAYAMQVLYMFDIRSILDVDDNEKSIFGAFIMQVHDMFDK